MASPLQIFTHAAQAIAASIIGTEPITIGGGASISGILNEGTFHKDYEIGGFERSASLEFVIDRTAFFAAYPAAVSTYEGKKATARGETWRVGTIKIGGPSDGQFVIVSLVTENKSS